MMKLMILLCALVACQAKNLEDPAASLYGDYKLVYGWPKFGKDIPNCSPVVVAAPELSSSGCKCGRQSASIGLFSVQSRSRRFTLLADIVSDGEELKRALADKCSCDDDSIDHAVVMKLSGGYMVHFDTNISKGFLIGRSAPSADQLQDIISSLPLDARDGSLVCQ